MGAARSSEVSGHRWVVVPLVAFVIYKTPFGLRVRAAGEPASCDRSGHSSGGAAMAGGAVQRGGVAQHRRALAGGASAFV